MTKEDAIKYLRQIYPNGGHCWLDEQRIEAIGMAVNALQEEPVNVWHNMDEVPIKGEVIVVQTKDTFYGISVQKGGTTYKNKDRYVRWAYASDLLNLSNVERTTKNWKEEPINEEWIEELRTKLDSMSKEEFEQVWKKYETGEKEEPVSEELEEAVNAYIGYAPEVDESSSTYGKRQAFKAGAKWQRQKDEKILAKNNDEYTEGVRGEYITVTK